MKRFVRDEAGFTLVELAVVMFVTVLLMVGLSNVFVSGLRTSSTANAALASQTYVHTALDRLEYETRCTSAAALVSSGAGVTLTLPAQCSNASGTITWCVSGGSLIEHSGSSTCTGTVTGTSFATGVTSTNPFSCVSTVGDYPLLQIALSVQTQSSADLVSATDQIAMRNASLTTSTTTSCS